MYLLRQMILVMTSEFDQIILIVPIIIFSLLLTASILYQNIFQAWMSELRELFNKFSGLWTSWQHEHSTIR